MEKGDRQHPKKGTNICTNMQKPLRWEGTRYPQETEKDRVWGDFGSGARHEDRKELDHLKHCRAFKDFEVIITAMEDH